MDTHKVDMEATEVTVVVLHRKNRGEGGPNPLRIVMDAFKDEEAIILENVSRPHPVSLDLPNGVATPAKSRS